MRKFIITSVLLMVFISSVWASETEKLTLEEWKSLQSVANDFQLMAYFAWELEEATVPYYEGNFEIAKYSLSHVAKILEFYAEQESTSSARADLAFVYLRLGKIAEQDGNAKAKQEYYEKGTDAYNKAVGKSYLTSQLVEFIEKIDADPQSKVRQFPTFADAIAPNPYKASGCQ